MTSLSKGEVQRRRKLRRNANNELSDILFKWDNRCYYCNREIIEIKSIPSAQRIGKFGNMFKFRADGATRIVAIASVDHIFRVRDGGGNRGNLVPACLDCNKKREI